MNQLKPEGNKNLNVQQNRLYGLKKTIRALNFVKRKQDNLEIRRHVHIARNK